MAQPLHMQLTTTDPSEMTECISVTAPNAVISKRRTGRFFAGIDAIRFSNLSMMRITTRNIDVKLAQDSAYTSLTIPLQGGFEIDRWRRCDHYDGQTAYVQSLDCPLHLSAAYTSVLVVNIDRNLMRSTSNSLVGRGQPNTASLQRPIALSNHEGARLWRSAMSLWSTDRRLDSVRIPDFVRAELEHEIAASIVSYRGIGRDPSLQYPGAQRATTAVRRVEEWVVANLDRPISRAILCEVSGLQPRALSRAFAKHHGSSPMQFVRDRRLDAVQRSLFGSSADDTTVTRTALDMGFSHLGRFAAAYQATFGEHPSETLHC